MEGESPITLAKSADGYTIPDLKQNIEALANLSFSRTLSNIQDVTVRRDSFEVTTIMDEVSLEDARSAYMDTYEALLTHFRMVKREDKQVLLVKLSLGDASPSSQKFYVTTQIGQTTRAKSMIDCSNYFNTGYMVGWPVTVSGTCNDSGSPNGNLSGSVDADTELDRALATIISSDINLDVPGNAPCFVGWLEVSSGQDPSWETPLDWDPIYFNYPNPDDDVLNDSYRDYLVYTSLPGQENDWDQCLETNDMNWYLCNYVDIVRSVPVPSSMALVSAGVNYTCATLCYPEQHFVTPYFGTPLFTSNCGGNNPPGDQPADDEMPYDHFDPDDGAYAPELPDYGGGPF
jgi:hypothetical protein